MVLVVQTSETWILFPIFTRGIYGPWFILRAIKTTCNPPNSEKYEINFSFLFSLFSSVITVFPQVLFLPNRDQSAGERLLHLQGGPGLRIFIVASMTSPTNLNKLGLKRYMGSLLTQRSSPEPWDMAPDRSLQLLSHFGWHHRSVPLYLISLPNLKKERIHHMRVVVRACQCQPWGWALPSL